VQGWISGPEPALNQVTKNPARLREALRGDLGEQLCGHITCRVVDALHARTVALLDNPVISTPDRRPIPWPAFLTVTCR
jgi:hypothetical protein